MNKPLQRAQIAKAMTWDTTRLYRTDEDWQRDFEKAEHLANELAACAGTLSSGEAAVHKAITLLMQANQTLERVGTYAMMRMHEDTSCATYQALSDRAMALGSRIAAAGAFLTPELLSLSEGTLGEMIADPKFSDYSAFLDDVLHLKPHVLGAAEERLLAMAQEALGVPSSVEALLTGADLDLGKTLGEAGDRVELSDATYMGLLTSENRMVRRKAWQNMMRGYGRMGNTFAALYAGQVKGDLFTARARGYATCREQALDANRVDPAVYDSLIEAVHGGIGTLDAYLDAKREALGLSRLHLYDLYAQRPSGFALEPKIEEAFEIFLQSVAPLGEDYVRDASLALDDRWIDVLPNKNKRSGAYSTGVYGTPPYVLLNHEDSYEGLSTLCHEMGHAMHTYYAQATQPYPKADYSIFVAEVASTTNEILLNEYLRAQNPDDRQAQLALIGHLLEGFRTTVFRQTLFAEFELLAHGLAEAGESLTQERLCALYLELNRRYYGGSCVVDPDIQNEWMRIPHFYSPFYVYQYATGFSAAAALAHGVLSGDPERVRAYREFLSLGGSVPPIEALRVAGVDLASPEVVTAALDYFAELVLQYKTLIGQERA